ncbi:hypothetical protein DWB63_02450 [Pseudodesulfovibrio sp. S3]|nr:hypothetical protein DWB63_02450 [Pseudodesulfovibrio sp. S3]
MGTSPFLFVCTVTICDSLIKVILDTGVPKKMCPNGIDDLKRYKVKSWVSPKRSRVDSLQLHQ